MHFITRILKLEFNKMELSEAIKIVRQLTEGKDPETGEHLPPGSPCLCLETARGLFLAVSDDVGDSILTESLDS